MTLCAVKWCAALATRGETCPVHAIDPELHPEPMKNGGGGSNSPEECDACGGSGECERCEGFGEHNCYCADCGHVAHECGACEGGGECAECEGEGKVADEAKKPTAA